MEIITAEWRYVDDVSKIMVRHPSKLGCKSKATPPQAPAIQVSARNLPPNRHWAILAQAWNFMPSCGYTRGPFTQTKMGHSIAKFEPEDPSRNFRIAVLRCSFNKGAGIACRENHIAIKVDLVEIINLQTMEYREALLPEFPSIRTCRIDVSEKKMRALRALAQQQQQQQQQQQPALPAPQILPSLNLRQDENFPPQFTTIMHAAATDAAAARIREEKRVRTAQEEARPRLEAVAAVAVGMLDQTPNTVASAVVAPIMEESNFISTTPQRPLVPMREYAVMSTVNQIHHYHPQGSAAIDSHLNDSNVQWDAILEDLVLAGPTSSPFRWNTPPRPPVPNNQQPQYRAQYVPPVHFNRNIFQDETQ